MSIPIASNGVEYIDSTDFITLEFRLTKLKEIMDDNVARLSATRKLRYSEVDIEGMRELGKLQPDEVYVPQHIIDTNIRQEQSAYVQFISQSPRAVICTDQLDKTFDLALLDEDLTEKLRYEGWQSAAFSNIDAFQQNGYSVMEVVQNDQAPGGISREVVLYSDFAFINDTKNLQNVEMCARSFYFTKTQLQRFKDSQDPNTPDDNWNPIEVTRIMDMTPSETNLNPDDWIEEKDRSLYRIQKVMFRVKGIVNVAWICIGHNRDWLRKPRPLFLGRRQLVQENKLQQVVRVVKGGPPPSQEDYETEYPYFLYPYLITENDLISYLKGRVYLDQDAQEAATSLISSTLTQARRAAGQYFSKETSDPNDDVLLDKNVYFKQNCLINANVKAFKIDAPDPGTYAAIQALITAKQAETSKVAFAVQNRKDSRKTKKELDLAEQTEQQLSTVQVALYSIALCAQFNYEVGIIKSRVLAGIIQVTPQVMPLYQRNFKVKPSGDVDVIEKQQIIQMMQATWPVIQQTPAAPLFLADLLEKMFPNNATKYVQAIQQGQQQQQSQQMQQMQAIIGQVVTMMHGIVHLSKHPEYFSDSGQLHAYPVVELASERIQQLEKQMKLPV